MKGEERMRRINGIRDQKTLGAQRSVTAPLLFFVFIFLKGDDKNGLRRKEGGSVEVRRNW